MAQGVEGLVARLIDFAGDDCGMMPLRDLVPCVYLERPITHFVTIETRPSFVQAERTLREFVRTGHIDGQGHPIYCERSAK